MGMLGQIKDAMKMRSEAKRIQNEITKITVDHSNAGITVTARGDMSIDKITFAPDALDEAKAGKTARFETMLTSVVNGALKRVKEATQAEMAKMMQSGGLGNLFGN